MRSAFHVYYVSYIVTFYSNIIEMVKVFLVTVREGDLAVLPCNITYRGNDVPDGYVIVWLRHNVPIYIKVGGYLSLEFQSLIEDRISMNDHAKSTANLEIRNVTTADAGRYLCKVILQTRREELKKTARYNITVVLHVNRRVPRDRKPPKRYLEKGIYVTSSMPSGPIEVYISVAGFLRLFKNVLNRLDDVAASIDEAAVSSHALRVCVCFNVPQMIKSVNF
ncbi:unnamed protein product [Clavelina lepadiformis]|uniref:Ig-like domain-containing protein n=1 Tax=Clavelina lepadiformis TaxID=159417 RepID=A0ABP0GNW0_CLALP